MVESVILLLIQICIVVGVCWLVIWVLGMLGVGLPERVIQIFWVIVVLVVLLLLWRTFGGVLSGGHLLR
jgi:hypothetical protein